MRNMQYGNRRQTTVKRYITIDGGTTNTRIRLIENGTAMYEIRLKAGAGNKNEILEKIFEYFYRELRPALTADEHMALDNLADELGSGENRKQTVYKITRLLYNAGRNDKTDVADLTGKLILEKLPSKLSEEKIAENIGIGRYYLHYRFKMQTGITVEKYIDVLEDIKQADK